MDKKEIIIKIIENSFRNREGHIGSSLSVLDFLICLYSKILNITGDEFVLSKGHASLGWYAVLLSRGLISEEEFFSFCQFDSILGGHPSSKKLKYAKISTGSLGHGFPFAVGLAMAKKIKNEAGQIYCLIGDGEANEGTIWESALISSTYSLNNLTLIMDFNKSGERAIKMNSCVDKFKSFGWDSTEADGHDQGEIYRQISRRSLFPKFVQLNTIKGKGCLPMENNAEWHHKSPNSEEEYLNLINNTYD